MCQWIGILIVRAPLHPGLIQYLFIFLSTIFIQSCLQQIFYFIQITSNLGWQFKIMIV
jgi:hypothetical protein